MVEIDVYKLVDGAFNKARDQVSSDDGNNAGLLHRRRSQAFVGYLGKGLEAAYASEPDVITLWQGNSTHRRSMGMNELLFDVTVCRVVIAESPARNTQLSIVSESLWSIESEFARDSREAIFDFNKLVLSTSGCKLFVAPHVGANLSEAFRASLGIAADFCTGSVFLAQVPHPADWADSSSKGVEVWERVDGTWNFYEAR